MTFEIFEQMLNGYGYGIVAMNHYSLNGIRHLYCVVLHRDGQRAIKAEGKKSNEVFKLIYNQILNGPEPPEEEE